MTADLGFSAFWTFLWFVGFCFLADQWRKSPMQTQNVTNHARAAIAFSFFSIFTWVRIELKYFQRKSHILCVFCKYLSFDFIKIGLFGIFFVTVIQKTTCGDYTYAIRFLAKMQSFFSLEPIIFHITGKPWIISWGAKEIKSNRYSDKQL